MCSFQLELSHITSERYKGYLAGTKAIPGVYPSSKSASSARGIAKETVKPGRSGVGQFRSEIPQKLVMIFFFWILNLPVENFKGFTYLYFNSFVLY